MNAPPLNINFVPFPLLETERLLLRKMVPGDAADFYKLRSDKETMRFIPRPIATCVADAAAGIQMMDDCLSTNNCINWGITLKGTDTVIGTIGFFRMNPESFRAEIGYILHKDHQRKGIMQEALNKAIDYGFHTMHLHAIEAVVAVGNTPSAALLEKSGFAKEGTLRDYIFNRGVFCDAWFYSRLTSS